MEVSPLGLALLRWISTFSSTTSVTSLVQLQDGIVLWEVLQKIGADFFITGLPHTDAKDVEMRWQNCKLRLVIPGDNANVYCSEIYQNEGHKLSHRTM